MTVPALRLSLALANARADGCAVLRIWLGFALLVAPPVSAGMSLPYRPDRILIQPKHGLQPQVESLLKARGAKVLHSFDKIADLKVVQVPKSLGVAQFISECQASRTVEFAEPDYLLHTFALPNDPKYLDGTQWGLDKISAPEAWNTVTSASNIVVAVVDTGVRYTHQDLASNMWTNPHDGGHGLNVFTGTNDPNDDNGHGTMVAGVLGGVGNNGIGIAGVAWRVQIMACKSFDSFQTGSISTCVAGLDYARTNGARIINASWGFGTNSLALSNAVYSLREERIILVAACGNTSTNLDVSPVYPACSPLDNVLSVAYTTRDDILAAPSNYGSTNVDLAAPGEQIYSTFGASDSFYYTQSGTSFAAPYVSGTMALVLATHPGEPPQESIARLLNGTDPLPALAGKCRTGGRLNAAHALTEPLRLIPLGLTPDGLMQLRVTADPYRTFVLQSTGNLLQWTPRLTNSTDADGTFEFIDSESGSFSRRFYRAIGQD